MRILGVWVGELRRLVAGFAGRRVLVIGEAMLDRYLHGDAHRLAREAPVPVVAVARREDSPGGAANTAANVAALGAAVVFLSVVGDDAEGDALRAALRERNVLQGYVFAQAGRATLAKNRVLAAGQLLVRFDGGDTDDAAPEIQDALVAALEAEYPRCDAVIVSDYGYGVLTARVRGALARLRERDPRPLLVDAKDLPGYRDLRPTAITPNYEEARALLGIERVAGGDRAAQIAAHAGDLFVLTGAARVVVTLDVEGAIVLTRGEPPLHLPAYARTDGTQTRTTGAGDTFAAAFALALAAGGSATDAARVASVAAGVVVARPGTAACTHAELLAAFAAAPGDGNGEDVTESHDWSLAGLLPVVAAYHAAERRVVFTNGCFDILHRGHTDLLAAARARGDVLIVGVNTDASVRRLKGPTRPVNRLPERAAVLAALRSVDHVVAFADGEDDPQHLIRTLRPHVFVKGGDYTRDTLPEAALVESLGGAVVILPYLPDHSTTRTIARASAGGGTEGR